MMRCTLRRLAAGVLAGLISCSAVLAEPRHGLSAFGDLKYPPDFTKFGYVNPEAGRTGTITTLGTAGVITFDSLNGYILRGDPAQRLDLLFDSLMVRAFDEPDAVYGLLAQSADLAEDKMSVTFVLRDSARFADGSPVTADDVANSFSLLKTKGHPRFQIQLRDVKDCEVIDEHTVRYTFNGKNVRDLPMIVATLPVFSKAYYDTVDFAKSTLVPPLGSGPYKVKDFKQGSFITYERREDYWAKDLPVNRGRYNFAEIKLLYFRDRTAELEALKAGELDLREEFTSKDWATAYDTPAVKDGRLIKADLPDDTASGAQGFFINMRRAKFADPRTRQALGLAFDFEWSNTNLFFDLYARTTSFFENSTLKAQGKPSGREREILASLGDLVPADLFSDPVMPPVSDGSGRDRKLLGQANKLLLEAGWKRQGGKLVGADGKPFAIEFLIFSSGFERIISPYVRNLEALGIDATIRQVEAAQYQERLKNFDFDISVQRYTMSETPGVELRAFFHSSTADTPGSFNMAGLKSKAVDQLIEQAMQAGDRNELQAVARALDRVLRGQHLWVPHWYKGLHNVAYWDRFAMPQVKPRFQRGILETWWVDEAKDAVLRKGP